MFSKPVVDASAEKRTFWTGALVGAALACLAEELVRQQIARRRKPVLVAKRGRTVLQLPLRPAAGARPGPSGAGTAPVEDA